jgi:hypothetical protein
MAEKEVPMNYRHIRTSLVAILAFAMLAAAAPAVAGEQVEVPVKESLSGYVVDMMLSPGFPVGDTFDGRCSEPSQWVSTSVGSGVMSHLGSVTWTLEHCYQLFEGTFGDAEVVITAANGDRLFGTFDGVMTSETTFAESLVVTGGTGRFSGATGSISETGWFDPVSGYMEVSGSGTLTYDASNRAMHD